MIHKCNFYFWMTFSIHEETFFNVSIINTLQVTYWIILYYLPHIWKFHIKFNVNSCDDTLYELDNTIQILTFQCILDQHNISLYQMCIIIFINVCTQPLPYFLLAFAHSLQYHFELFILFPWLLVEYPLET